MFEPIRGGTRGGQAEFKWSDVSADKDREVRLFSIFPLSSIIDMIIVGFTIELSWAQYQCTHW